MALDDLQPTVEKNLISERNSRIFSAVSPANDKSTNNRTVLTSSLKVEPKTIMVSWTLTWQRISRSGEQLR